MTKETLWSKLRELWAIRKRCQEIKMQRKAQQNNHDFELTVVRKTTFEAQQAALREGIRAGKLEERVATLEQQLATERQRHEQDIEDFKCYHHNPIIKHLNEQLLSAQAAIEKHNKDYDPVMCEEIEVDLSALHKHDAEVRKPLVDLLLEIRELMPNATMKDLKDRIDALVSHQRRI